MVRAGWSRTRSPDQSERCTKETSICDKIETIPPKRWRPCKDYRKINRRIEESDVVQSMWCHRSLGKKSAHSLPKAARRDRPLQRAEEKVVGSGENSDGKGRGGSSNYPIAEVYNDDSKTQTSHMKVPPGFAVLDCGAAKSLCGAKPVAQMAQTCAREGKRVGDKRDTEAIDESYHFRRIGNQIVSSFMKLRVPGSIDGKEVSFSPSVTPGDIPPLVGNGHLDSLGLLHPFVSR